MKKIIPLVFVVLSQISCAPDENRFFMRYKSDDPERLEKDIADKIIDIKNTNDDYEIFVKTLDLSENLTVAGRENEAIVLLQYYIVNKELKAEDEDLPWLYLNYATAAQYAGKSDTAELYFKKALSLAEKKNLESVTHYILHHYGRFLVEQEEYESAKEYFTSALSLRQKLRDQRVVSTQMALDSLDIIMRQE